MINQQQINDMVKDTMPEIINALRNEIRETTLNEVRRSLQNEVQSVVKEWVVQNLVPEIHNVLIEGKEGLISVAPVLAEQVSLTLAETLKETIAKKMESSWERKKIFEALLG